MISTCIKCGNHSWDKKVDGNIITCPKCGNKWSFNKLPLYILTGCSGIGKSTTAEVLKRKYQDIIFLEADIFNNIMPHQTEEDDYNQVEQIQLISKNISQSGKPVLWTMAGRLDKLNNTYNRRFFSDIYILALVASEETLKERMINGRGIKDKDWIQGSIQYNNYFLNHDTIFNMPFEKIDTTNKGIEEVSELVKKWIISKKENKGE